ncbi:MAG: hypothetical protein R6U52_06120 [Kosmotogaceae bacterium]
MNIRAGGFLLQGLISIPFLEAVEETDELEFEETVLNGLAGFYWIIRIKHGREFALRKLMMFINRFHKPIKAMGREFNLKNKYQRKLDRDYCASWTVTDHVCSWQEIETIIKDIEDTPLSNVLVEVIDIANKKVSSLKGNTHYLLKSSVAFPGLFPPLEGNYLSSIYYSQIPLYGIKNADLVLVNLRNTEMLPVKNANQILVQSLELRSGELARKILHEVSPSQISSNKQVNTNNLSAFINTLDTMKEKFKVQLNKTHFQKTK